MFFKKKKPVSTPPAVFLPFSSKSKKANRKRSFFYFQRKKIKSTPVPEPRDIEISLWPSLSSLFQLSPILEQEDTENQQEDNKDAEGIPKKNRKSFLKVFRKFVSNKSRRNSEREGCRKCREREKNILKKKSNTVGIKYEVEGTSATLHSLESSSSIDKPAFLFERTLEIFTNIFSCSVFRCALNSNAIDEKLDTTFDSIIDTTDHETNNIIIDTKSENKHIISKDCSTSISPSFFDFSKEKKLQ
mmetsp:Transcript_35464/g.82292  ORF Transcript_35464/g.82292 Transcript_35464/m.82292 type:complete len:245 (+) Transcript_35464:165-899(+)